MTAHPRSSIRFTAGQRGRAGHNQHSTPPASQAHISGSAVASLSGIYAAAGTLGLGATRVAYDDFYGQFGTSLDAVGLSSAKQLTLAAVASFVLVGFTIWLYAPVRFVLCQPIKYWMKLPFVLLWLPLATAALFLPARAQACFIGLCFVLGFSVPLFFLPWVRTTFRAPWLAALPSLRGTAGLTVVTIIVFVIGPTIFAADSAGRNFQLTGERSSRIKLLDVPVTPVCVWTLDGEALPNVKPSQLLLGGSNGMYVLFSPGPSARAIMLPVAATQLLGRRAGAAC